MVHITSIWDSETDNHHIIIVQEAVAVLVM